MRFGLSGIHGGLEGDGPTPTVRLAEIAERLGFDCLWFNEEHFQRGGRANRQVLAPIVLAAAIAARTTRIRLGFSVVLVTLHNPLRIAEDIATLDVLSDGRVNFGIARPGNGTYAAAFDWDAARGPDLPDTIDRVLGYWEGEPIAVAGARHRLSPRPVQEPHPPVFVAGYTDQTIAWTAGRGYPLMQHGIQSPASLARCLRTFSEHGGQAAEVPVGRFCFVAESDDAARRQVWPTVVRLTERLREIGIHRRGAGLITTSADLDPERFYRETAIIGSPETVVARITELAGRHGIRYVNLLPAFFGFLPEELLMRSLELFASEVAPKLIDDTLATSLAGAVSDACRLDGACKSVRGESPGSMPTPPEQGG